MRRTFKTYGLARQIRLLLLILSAFSLCAGPANAEKNPSVVILPFSVHAAEELNYLSTQIATLLSEHLEREGATTVVLAPEDVLTLPKTTPSAEAIAAIADRYEADRLIWGSLTAIGDSFSVDATMISPLSPSQTASFNASGQKIENLLNVLKQLADKIQMTLFQRSMVSEVKVLGNERIESDAILRVVKTKPGTVYKNSQLSADLKTIFRMGYFDDLRVEAESGDDGMLVTFYVKEKRTIRRIKITGNLRFDDEKIRENLTLSTGAIVNIFKIQSNIDQIVAMYKEKKLSPGQGGL
jgi:outer membrane protein insertion porin family